MAQKAPPAALPGFSSLGLDDRLVKTLAELGYEEPTPIQREAIPPLLAGKDLVGQAATGTGKTAAFALPLLHRLATAEPRGPRPLALVLVPTRELAMQVAEAVHRYGRPLEASVLPIYGGQAYGPQLRALERGVDVVVATPGRALDHVRGKNAEAGRRGRRGPGRGRRDARYGLRRGHRVDPLRDAQGAADRALLGHAAAPHRGHRQAPPERPGADQDRRRARGGRHRGPGAARRPISSLAATSWPPSVACSTWRTRPRPSSSAAAATRSTSWPRTSTRGATVPRRCTAA